MEKNVSFGEWLRRCRGALDLTQRTFAEHLGYAFNTYRKVENDERQPSQAFIDRLGDYLGISMAERAALQSFVSTGSYPAPEALLLQLLSRRTNDTPPSQPIYLPLLPTRLIGREAEYADLLAFLSEGPGRLVTLIGPPGVGKTRLAKQVANAVGGRFDDGVFFVALDELYDPGMVAPTLARVLGVKEEEDMRALADLPAAPTLARVLGVKEQGSRSIQDTLMAYLHTKCMLLVLDSFEHVLEAAPLVTEVLEACVAVKLIVTSRVPLNVRAEWQFLLQPLAFPDPASLPVQTAVDCYPAVMLFVDRAKAVRRDFTLTSENSSVIAAICARLDGLPLALELAAQQCKLMSPQQLLRRLDQRLALLCHGPRDLPMRHRSLRVVLDSSYIALPPAWQILFRRLAVFVGGSTLDAVAQVCFAFGDLGSGVLEGLHGLVDWNLVQSPIGSDGEVRFTMLETVQEYAQERLAESDEINLVRQAHSAYYRVLVEQSDEALQGPEQHFWLSRLREEYGNVLSALRYAYHSGDRETVLRFSTALFRFWNLSGTFKEGRHWLEIALMGRDQLPEQLTAKALNGLGWLMLQEGDSTQARRVLEESVAIWRRQQDPAQLARATNNLGVVVFEQGEYLQASTLFHESITLRRSLGDEAGQIDPLINAGTIGLLCGDIEHAIHHYDQSLRLSRRVGTPHQTASCLINLGWAFIVQGTCGQAIEPLQECIALTRELGFQSHYAIALNNLGVVALDCGDMQDARKYIGESLQIHANLGDRFGITENLYAFASLAAQQAQWERVARLLGAAITLRNQLGMPLSSDQQTVYERYLTPARVQIDAKIWERCMTIGAAMSLDHIIALALS